MKSRTRRLVLALSGVVVLVACTAESCSSQSSQDTSHPLKVRPVRTSTD